MTRHVNNGLNERLDESFDETLLSGYLDGELTQGDQQRVRLHLEENADAREVVEEMRRIREAARTTDLPAPSDEEWNEAPRSVTSSWFRRTGWVVLVGWATVLAGVTVSGLIVGPETWWQRLLAFAAVGGPVALFLSILIDRLKLVKHDRYRRVKR